MKKLHAIKTITALSILLASLTIASCDNSYGVFSEVQTEKAHVGTTIFKNSTVKSLGEDGLNYYAVMSKVYSTKSDPATFATGSWTVLPINGLSAYYVAGFATDATSGKIYAATMDAVLSTFNGIYASGDSGSTWTEIPSTAIGVSPTVSVDALYWAGDTLFALAHDQTAATYRLYYSNGLAAFATTTISYSGTDTFPNMLPIIAVVKAGSTYWALTQTRIYSGASPSTLAFDATASTPTGTIPTGTSGSVLCSIAVNSANSVLVTRFDGYLYTLTSGVWTSAVVITGSKLGVLAEVPTTPPTLTDKRLILAKDTNLSGSSGGYCEWNALTSTEVAGNDSLAIFSPTSSGYTTTIYNKPVQSIYYSSTNKTILIGLAAQGSDSYALYSNTYSGGAWSGWTAE